jgi:hypothetical protein
VHKVTFLIYFHPTILLHTVLDVGYCRYLLISNP